MLNFEKMDKKTVEKETKIAVQIKPVVNGKATHTTSKEVCIYIYITHIYKKCHVFLPFASTLYKFSECPRSRLNRKRRSESADQSRFNYASTKCSRTGKLKAN